MLSALVICLALQDGKPSLSFENDRFLVQKNKTVETVPVRLPKDPPKERVNFRRDNKFAVWDDRGLTIRVGKKVHSTKLTDIATSPKVQTREEIRAALDAMKRHDRRKQVTGLSGAVRVGTDVYFLVRWDTKKGTPWLEVLVKVDLAAKAPTPSLVGKFSGFSLGEGTQDDKLFLLGGRPAAITRGKEAWGIARYDVKEQKASFDDLGKSLVSYIPLTNRLIAFVEKTTHGTVLVGRADLITLSRKEFMEDRGTVKFLDSQQPPIAIVTGPNGGKLHNTDSGAELSLEGSFAARRTQSGIVVWTPYQNPTQAWLYDPTRWDSVAKWAKP